MSHEIENMFSVKQTPWHGLGKILNEAPNAEKAIIEAGLDWKVEKRKMHWQSMSTEFNESPDRYAVIRTSDETYLGDAGKNWEPLQNTEAFKFFDPFIASGEASFETAGSLSNGKRIWVLAKINREPIEVVKGDFIEKYILLSNYHRSGVSVRGALTPIRVVCANTEALAFRHHETLKFRATHSKNMSESLEKVQESIALADSCFKQTAEFYKQFAKKQVNEKMFTKFVNSVFDYADVVKSGRETAFKEKQTETIRRLFETGRGTEIQGVRGTVWGLYNSVTEWIQHEAGKIEDKRLESAWFGAGKGLNLKAFEVAKEMAVL